MLEQITLGQISLGISFLVSLIGGIIYLKKHVRLWIESALKGQLDAINNRLEKVDLEGCKNYLVSILSRIERGDQLDEIEKERLWEQYQHYTEAGGNSYIKRKVEKLKIEGKM